MVYLVDCFNRLLSCALGGVSLPSTAAVLLSKQASAWSTSLCGQCLPPTGRHPKAYMIVTAAHSCVFPSTGAATIVRAEPMPWPGLNAVPWWSELLTTVAVEVTHTVAEVALTTVEFASAHRGSNNMS